MKTFISWSGTTSHSVAIVLRDWLPTVLQTIDPWVSSEDITKGRRWSGAIAKELADSRFGVICVDQSNVESPWLNFEAGALSTLFESGRVAPFLLGLSPSDVGGPLAQFQMTTVSEKDVLRLVESINQSMGSDGIPTDRLRKTYSYCWPGLRDALREIDLPAPVPKAADDPPQAHPESEYVSDEAVEVLTMLAEKLDSSDQRWIPLDNLARAMRVTPTKMRYILLELSGFGLVRIDNDGDPWLEDEGVRYLGENAFYSPRWASFVDIGLPTRLSSLRRNASANA